MKQKVLILGGTEFVGRQLVEKLLVDTSKEIYLFNRGKTNPNLFPDVNVIIGDRETDDIKQLKMHQWDYIIDFSSYYPKSLRDTLEQINKDVKQYVYISTISVFSFEGYDLNFGIKEEHTKVSYTAEELVDKTLKTYGKKKAACEVVLKEAEWLNKTILRPSIIYGKYDPTDRFYFWLKKIKEQEKVLLPDNGKHKFSLTFADDLVKIILSILNGDLKNDIYNCSTHPTMSIMEMMNTAKEVLNSKCEFIDIGSKELKENSISLPISFGGDVILNNDKIVKSLPFKFQSFKDSVVAVVEHYDKETWKDCSIKIDKKVERKLLVTRWK